MNKSARTIADLNPSDAWKPFEPSRPTPWTHQLAAHLYRRSGFGGTIDEITSAQKMGPTKAIDQIFAQTDDQEIENERLLARRL